MTTPSLSVNRLINVSVNLSPKAAVSQNLSTMMILGSSSVIDTVERYRSYTDLSAVAGDFGTTLPEYFAALVWFEQTPQPASLLIGRWAQSATAGVLKGATLSAAQQLLSVFTAITAGKFAYAFDGGSVLQSASINLSGAVNLPAVAALLTAGATGMTFTWNSNFQRFEATSLTTGAASAVAFLTTPGTGTDLSGTLGMSVSNSGSYVANGVIAETAVAAAALFDSNYGQTFYGFSVIGVVDADHLVIAPLIEASGNKHTYWVTTNEAGALVPSYTTDIAYELKQLNLNRTFVQYSSANAYAADSAAARLLPVDFTGNNTAITLMYKQEPGITAENLNETQAESLEAKNCNVFVNYNNDTAILEDAVMSSGEFADVITGTDWLAVAIQTALYNLYYLSKTKIPQTDAGSNQAVNVIEAVCAQGVINGLLAPGVWTSGGFGQLNTGDFLPKGYYVYAQPVAQQNLSDRGARKSVPFQIAVKLAGAVHTANVSISVNQ